MVERETTATGSAAAATKRSWHHAAVLIVAGMLVCGTTVVREAYRSRAPVTAVGVPGVIWDGESLRLGDLPGGVEGEGEQLPARLRPFFFQPIPINSAGRELLMTVPGVGPATADAILRLREERGDIESAADLLLVDGVGSVKQKLLDEAFSY